MSIPQVYLVGAGPGDPGLITLRGVELLARADLVLYDYLVNPQILEHAQDGAELVCLGRHGAGRIIPQEEIHARMVEAAQAGRTVVRLKGGDPVVFGRLAEEATALTEAGIAYEVVPGVTAALAAGSYVGIPLTHRDRASAVALITGQEVIGKQSPAVDFDALAKFPGTLVFYMGVTTAPEWSRHLVDAGKPASTPVAIVRRCSWPDQQVTRCTLGELSEVLAPGQMRPPAVVVVGEVVPLADTLGWLAQRPLLGKSILITRPAHQIDPFRDQMAELGAEVLLQPAITISDPPDWRPVDAAIDRLDTYDWLVFSSSNGVRYFLNRLAARGLDARSLGHLRLAAMGPGTAAALEDQRLRADLLPDEYRAEALADALSDQARGKRFLLARASRGRPVLGEQLAAAGGHVEEFVVYTSQDCDTPDPEIVERMASGRIDWTTVTSSAIARSLVAMFGPLLEQTRLVSISPITSGVLQELGYPPAAEAAEYTTAGVLAAIQTCQAP